LLLLGQPTKIDKARAFLEGGETTNRHIPDFDRAVLNRSSSALRPPMKTAASAVREIEETMPFAAS
jgi:hypothetical protein